MMKHDFIARLTYLTKEEGGRNCPAYSKYRPHVEFDRIKNVLTSGQQIFIGQDAVNPGETVNAYIKTLMSDFFIGKLQIGDEFNFSEGSRQVGRGKIISFCREELNFKNITKGLITMQTIEANNTNITDELKYKNRFIEISYAKNNVDRIIKCLINDLILVKEDNYGPDFKNRLEEYLSIVTDDQKTIETLQNLCNLFYNNRNTDK